MYENELAAMSNTELREVARALRYKYARSHQRVLLPHQQGATRWSIDDAQLIEEIREELSLRDETLDDVRVDLRADHSPVPSNGGRHRKQNAVR